MDDLISRQAAIEKFAMTAPQMSVIRIYEAVEILESMPTIQPVATDTNVGDTISRQQAIDALDCISGVEEVLRSLPTVQPEPAIPLSWIEGKIEWLNNMDNYFAELTANVIKTMLNEWRKGEQDATN